MPFAVAVAASVAAAVACAPERRAGADSATAGAVAVPAAPRATVPPAPPAFRAERRRDLTGDGADERLTIEATGPRDDSLAVRLTIRSSDAATVLYADRWSSADYFKYVGPPASLPADSVRRLVRRHLDALLDDRAFAQPPAGTAGASGELLEAVRYDVAEQVVRAERGVAPGDPLPADAHDAVERAAASPAVATRANAIAREVRGRPTFRYFAGGELTSTVAWSPSERRFVRVAQCC